MTILFPHHGSLLCIVSHLGCLLRVHEKHLSTVHRVVIFSLLFLILLETKRQSLCHQKIPSTYQTLWKVTKSVSLKSRMDLRLLKLPIRFMFRGLINYGLWRNSEVLLDTLPPSDEMHFVREQWSLLNVFSNYYALAKIRPPTPYLL